VTSTAAQPTGTDTAPYLSIQDYAVIGNGLTAALVSRDGSIDWACFPRFDSPSVFGRILDAGIGGSWSIAPTDRFTTERCYLDDTNVLRTLFHTAGGTAEVIDFMPTAGSGPERLGESAIVRIVRGLVGLVPFRLVFDPRFDYARTQPEWCLDVPLGAQALWGEQSLTLSTDIPVRLDGGCVQAEFAVTPGREIRFCAAYREPPPMFWGEEPVNDARRWQAETEAYWRGWLERCKYRGPHDALVRRSMLALKLLDHAPTGGIIAAPTTSLPECIGGPRNWDYRYCWVRDASFILNAFYRLGYSEEGEQFLGWLLDCTHDDPAMLQVMYRIDGSRDLTEEVLEHLEGYRGSRPVRIGNGAAAQLQLDAYGEIVDAAWLLHEHGGRLSARLLDFLCALVDYVCAHWREPDAGIWEVRGGYQHFVYSKVLCWVALDRGLRIAHAYGLDADFHGWRQVCAAIRSDIDEHGFDPVANTYRQSYGSDSVDASLLALPLRGFIAINDPRMAGTIARVIDELSEDGLLLRYRTEEVDDGVGGPEGAFLLCSFWLSEVLARSGRLDEAVALFDRLTRCANDLGLFAEQMDPETCDHLGNFPQGFTHVALVNAALAIADAQAAARPVV
jgi:GH15 family glucan-1,4-alpha-glucosidase